MLRAGYGGLALAFGGIAAGAYVPTLLLPALALALVAGLLLAISDDDLPKWAGLAIIAYFVLTVLVFLAATPITIDKGDGYFLNAAPTEVAQEAFYWLTFAAPLMLAGAAIVASWERELPSRVLLLGAVGGFILVGILTVALIPKDLSVDSAKQQGEMIKILLALSAAAGASGVLWAAGRPEEYA